MRQAYDSRDSEVAEGLRVNSEEDTSRQETHTNTLQRDVGAREEQEALEQSSRESAPERHSASYHFKWWRLMNNRLQELVV